jgi:CheY-like chemotaxis protein
MTVAHVVVAMTTVAAATQSSSDRLLLVRPPRHFRCSPAVIPGTILVVDDNDTARDRSVVSLRRLGYQVLAAARGGDALMLLDAHRGPLDLLVTRTNLPDMSGYVLAARVLRCRPAVRLLFTTGDLGRSVEAFQARVAALIDRRCSRVA